MSLIIVRFFVIATGLIYLGLGLSFLFATHAMVSKLPLMPTSPDGTTELRAVYGGLELALGVIFIYAGGLNRSLDFAAFLMFVTFAGVAATRFVGIFMDKSYSTFTLGLLAVETAGVLYSALSLFLLALHKDQ